MEDYNNKTKAELLEIIQNLEKKVEQLSSESVSGRKERFRDRYSNRILDNLPDMLTVLDRDANIVELVSSPSTNHVEGTTADSITQSNIKDILPEDAYKNIRKNMEQVFRSGKSAIARHDLMMDGVPHHYEHWLSLLDKEYLLCMCRDVSQLWETEQTNAEQQNEIMRLNSLMEAIVNNVPVYLFVKDSGNDFRYLYWNKTFADYSGIPIEKAIGRNDFEIFKRTEDMEKFRLDDIRVLKEGKLDYFEEYMAASGEIRTITTMKRLVPSSNEHPYIIGISWDITNFQNIEQELIKARIKAEQSDRLKTAFLANMSHEIRTPLNAIVGFSNLLPSAETLEEEKLYSSIINQNSEILLQLINDILDLSKIEAGTLEYVRQPMNLGEICRNIYQIHKDRVQEGVILILDNQDEDLIIEEDRNRIAQVITNFLTNAGKFTLSGEIRFGFKVNNQCIRFYVKDTGIGIAPDKVGHIFDRFVKLNSFAQGTGLGLAICRMIIEKIGGEIGATSEIGKGSTFYFTIPYKESSDDRIAFSEASETKYISHTIKRMQKIKKILVAEDVDSNFVLIKNMIGKDYTLLWAKDGFEAVEMYKQFQPDLILMDIKMPRMGGLEATRIIRSYSKEIPVIALTAYAFEADKEQALEAGCNDFVTKPVSKAALEEALGKCCG